VVISNIHIAQGSIVTCLSWVEKFCDGYILHRVYTTILEILQWTHVEKLVNFWLSCSKKIAWVFLWRTIYIVLFLLCSIFIIIFKSLVEKKKKMQEDTARLEAEIEQLRSAHEVSFWVKFLDSVIFCFHLWRNLWLQITVSSMLVFLCLSLCVCGCKKWTAQVV